MEKIVVGPPHTIDVFETINSGVWSDKSVVARFATASSWLDAGERNSVEAAARNRPAARVLDLGVGAGRTIPLMSRFGPGYVGLDYSDAMVEACRARYSGVNVVQGDARNLETFADGSFDLVFFSNNGIDAVGHSDRQRVLCEVRRVLQPGGIFLFSTYNLNGPSARERPWNLAGLDLHNARRAASRVKYRVATLAAGIRNYQRLARDYERGDGWAVRTNGSHKFGIVIHHTTLQNELAELAEAGFGGITVWSGNDGRVVNDSDDTRRIWYFHLLGIRQ